MTARFERISRIGSGGMGTVWKARDLRTGELVALKLMHEHLAEDEHLLRRFEHEVELSRRAMEGVASPNLVRVLGYGREDGRPYIAMELVEGPSLRAVLREREMMLPYKEALRYLRDIASALQAAHAAGVVHRDVKPSNILITTDGTAKLADFGIAKASDMTGLTGSNTALGTVQYMPPDRTSDFRSDFYSLGVVLYEMLTGRLPFEGTPGEIIAQHASAEPDLFGLEDSVGGRLVAWLMQKEPSRRPADAAQIIAALDGTTPPPEFRHTAERPGRQPRRRSVVVPAAFAAAALVLGAGGAVAAMFAFGGDDPPPVSPPPTMGPSVLPTDQGGLPTVATLEPGYVVRAGDTCSSIAEEMNVALGDLMLLPELAEGCDSLKVGQVIPEPRGSRCSQLTFVPPVSLHPTPCTVEIGELVTVRAWGEWCLGMPDPPSERVCFPAEGTDAAEWGTDLEAEANIAALIARVADGPWIVIGTRGHFIADRSGQLQLAFNDRVGFYSDNHGSLQVAFAVGTEGEE